MRKNLNSKYNYALGIDIGGSKVKIAVIDSGGNILWLQKEAVRKASRSIFIEQIISLIREGFRQIEPVCCMGIGIALPAVIDHNNDTIIQAPNLPVLNGLKLKSVLLREFETGKDRSMPIILGFDGTASVIAEAWQGAGVRCCNLITVAIGTGIGGGLMIAGRVITGYNNVAGAIGWSRLGIDRQTQSFESICAGPGIAAQGKELFKEKAGNYNTAEKIFDAAEEGDKAARQLISLIIRHVGVNMANLVSIINPEVIIFTGSVGLRLEQYLDRIQNIIISTAQPIAARSVRLVCSKLANNAGVIGAAGLIIKQGVIDGKGDLR